MALDADDLKKIGEIVAAATKDFAKAADLATVIKGQIDERLKDAPTAESIAAAAKKAADDALAAKGGADDKGKGKGADDAGSAALAALQKKIDEQTTAFETERKARIDAEARAVKDGHRSKVRDALTTAGVDAKALPLVMPYLESSGQLVLDGDKPGWKGKDKYGADTVLDFADGAKAFAGSDDGKRFVPAGDTRGTGDRAAERNGSGGATGPGTIRNADGSLNAQALAAKALASL